MVWSGGPLSLPEGNFTSLEILGAASGSNHYESATLWVWYTDGTYDTFTQDFSDWINGYSGTAGTTAPGETIVNKMNTYGTATGTVYLYGYKFPTNPSKTVEYLQISDDSTIKILAIDEVDQPEQVNLGAGNGQAPVADNQDGIGTTNTAGLASLDNGGDAYSSAAQPYGLGTTITWNLQTFDVPPAGYNDVVQIGGVSFYLPEGNFTSLDLLGTSISGHFETQVFSVYYTDGTHDTFTQGFSDWVSGYNGTLGSTAPNESVALTMRSFIGPTGVVSRNVNLYGYVFPLNPAKTVDYVQIPNDNAIKIVAIDEVYAPEQVNLGDATDSQSPAFNVDGISLSPLTGVTGGGIDGNGNSYSASAWATPSPGTLRFSTSGPPASMMMTSSRARGIMIFCSRLDTTPVSRYSGLASAIIR